MPPKNLFAFCTNLLVKKWYDGPFDSSHTTPKHAAWEINISVYFGKGATCQISSSLLSYRRGPPVSHCKSVFDGEKELIIAGSF